MPWYEFLEPLKPVVYCRFVQRCKKRVNPNLNKQNVLFKQFYINLFIVIMGFCNFVSLQLNIQVFWDVTPYFWVQTFRTLEGGGSKFVPNVGSKCLNVTALFFRRLDCSNISL
jgi:hypothetical protein